MNKNIQKEKSSVLWDKAAEHAQTEKVRGKFLTKLFLIPIFKSIRLVRKNSEEKLKILKVDLWNEGIDFQRNILKHLDRPENRLYGMDISYRTCTLAKQQEQSKNIAISTGTIDKLAFKEQSFDIILDLSTTDHLPRERLHEVFFEYQRTLKKKGVIVLIFDWWGLLWYLYMIYLEKIRGHGEYFFKDTQTTSRYIHPIRLMKRLLKDHNMIIKHEYCIDYTGWMWNRITKPFWMWLPDKGYDLILTLEYSIISKYLRPFAKQYVIIAQKK